MLRCESVAGFNPFDWDDLRCPFCGGNEFTSLDHAAVYCDDCDARFGVRPTAGDPGCVVDASVPRCGVYGTRHQCKCGWRGGRLAWMNRCPSCGGDDLTPEDGISSPVKLPDWESQGFYLVLKLGDYCSGWLANSGNPLRDRLTFPTQAEWESR